MNSIASKQIFTPDPYTKIACIREIDGNCIKETINVNKLQVTYTKSVFKESIGDSGAAETIILNGNPTSDLDDLKESIRNLPLVAPELASMAINILDNSCKREHTQILS